MTTSEMSATAKVGSDVKFSWKGYHNVWQFRTKAGFDACDFSKATELAGNDKNPFIYKASAPGTYYFGCEVGSGFHCKDSQKLALTVTGTFCSRANIMERRVRQHLYCTIASFHACLH